MYRIWVTIERENGPEDEEEYTDMDLPENLATFDTLEDAEEFVVDLLSFAHSGPWHAKESPE